MENYFHPAIIIMKTIKIFDNIHAYQLKEQLMFFLPLAVTSILILCVHSVLNAGIARLPNQEMNIAAFSVSKYTYYLFQCPVFSYRLVVITFIRNKKSLHKCIKFLIIIILFMYLIILILYFSGGLEFLLGEIMGLKGDTLNRAIPMFMWITPTIIFISLREFMWGIMIRLKMTYWLVFGTIARLIFVFSFIFAVEKVKILPTLVIPSVLFSGGVLIEAIVLVLIYIMIIKKDSTNMELLIFSEKDYSPEEYTFKKITRFYLPMILTSYSKNLMMPFINSALGRSLNPESALSTFSVSWDLGNTLLAPLNNFHQISLNYSYDKNRNFGLTTMLFGFLILSLLTFILAIISFTNVGNVVFIEIMGLNRSLANMAIELLRLRIIFPIFILVNEIIRGNLIRKKMTKYIAFGQLVNLMGLILSVLLANNNSFKNIAYVGLIPLFVGLVLETLFMSVVFTRKIKLIKYS